MDGTTASGENGFDAALRALEDLETSVAQAREDTTLPVDPTSLETISIELANAADVSAPAAITAVPVAELEELIASGVLQPSPEPPPAPPSASPTAAPVAPAPIAPASSVAPPAPQARAAEAPAAPTQTEAAPEKAKKKIKAATASGRWGKVAIGLGLASSIVSTVGLVIAERTIMSAQLVIADAREKQHQLETATQLLKDLKLVRDQQLQLLKAQQAQLASTPVTSDELQHRMETLQAGLLARDPLTAVVRAVNEDQLNNNLRFGEIGRKLDRIETQLGGH